MDPILKCDNVTFTYPSTGHEIIHGVSMEIEKGSFTAILGHNGSGKSTLCKLFNAILLPTSGKVYAGGMDTADESLLFSIRQKVGMVFQNPDNQIVSSVVEEDVAFAPENLGTPPEEIRRRVDDALATVGMTEYIRHAPHLLSGGQKQRIAIAGVIAMEPECIVLDEPTAMLDPTGREDVMHTLRKLNREKGITVVLVTHHMEEAMEADRVIVINDGRILRDADPRDVLTDVDMLESAGLSAPETVKLLAKLRSSGLDVDLHAMEPEACIEQILSELKGR